MWAGKEGNQQIGLISDSLVSCSSGEVEDFSKAYSGSHFPFLRLSRKVVCILGKESENGGFRVLDCPTVMKRARAWHSVLPQVFSGLVSQQTSPFTWCSFQDFFCRETWVEFAPF